MASASARRSLSAPGPPARQDLYRSGEVVEIVGMTRRQLLYWAQTDLVRPSARTRGGHHRYTFEDLVALEAAKRLIDAGVSVQRIRKSLEQLQRILPTVRRPLAELVLVATGDVVLVFREGTVFEAVSGQEWVLEVARFQRDVEAWRRKPRALRRLRPARAGAARARRTA
jgi:DNA-binding transcriptional MerR regulator